MAALTHDYDSPKLYGERFVVGPVAAATILYAGAMVCRNAAGMFVPASDTAALSAVVGRCAKTVDNSDGADGDVDAVLEIGVFGYDMHAALVAVADATLGVNVTVEDDHTVNIAGDTTNDIVAGRLEEVRGSVAYVAIGLV